MSKIFVTILFLWLTLYPQLLLGKWYYHYNFHSWHSFLHFCSHTGVTVTISTADIVSSTFVGTKVPLLQFLQQTFFHPHLQSKWCHYYDFHSWHCFLRFCSHSTITIDTVVVLSSISAGKMVALLLFPQLTSFPPLLQAHQYHYYYFCMRFFRESILVGMWSLVLKWLTIMRR